MLILGVVIDETRDVSYKTTIAQFATTTLPSHVAAIPYKDLILKTFVRLHEPIQGTTQPLVYNFDYLVCYHCDSLNRFL